MAAGHDWEFMAIAREARNPERSVGPGSRIYEPWGTVIAVCEKCGTIRHRSIGGAHGEGDDLRVEVGGACRPGRDGDDGIGPTRAE